MFDIFILRQQGKYTRLVRSEKSPRGWPVIWKMPQWGWTIASRALPAQGSKGATHDQADRIRRRHRFGRRHQWEQDRRSERRGRHRYLDHIDKSGQAAQAIGRAPLIARGCRVVEA